MRPHLFLDIDGVLNGHDFCESRMSTTIRRGRVNLLNEVLAETDAVVVLSSAWRYFFYRGEMNMAGLDWLLRSHGLLKDRLVGITRPDTLVERAEYDGTQKWAVCNERGQQIADYVLAHAVERYAVVDDGGYEDPPANTRWTDLGIRKAGHPVAWTDGKLGMTSDTVADLVRLLK